MPTPIIVATIAAIMGLIGFLLHVWNDRRKQWNIVAAAFRAVFLPTLTTLESEPKQWRSILKEHFPDHKNAAVVFRQHLGRRLASFNEVWLKYEVYTKEQTDVPVLFYLGNEALDMDRAADPKHIAEVAQMRKNECLAHIRPLLKFAKTK